MWNQALSKIKIEGNEADKTTFYTALYHTMIDPHCFSDIDGKYVGADNKIHL
ncbi:MULTISPECIES: glycoside hydrolase domain-containing protein [Bacteroides]|jgi:putative alpha-1,2-mannosidase|uniref:glycoside hydrolase domain-containing protein n=1 Tax=Bacteroides TaxID=816 RepID=UPI001F3BF5E2|nr:MULTISPECIES: glycoside hydrolase domain-containing protein [Bacteroides]MCS3201804.1 glycoside hydrolase family 92 protein [Candidatus Bacteroides intestinigallinarum]